MEYEFRLTMVHFWRKFGSKLRVLRTNIPFLIENVIFHTFWLQIYAYLINQNYWWINIFDEITSFIGKNPFFIKNDTFYWADFCLELINDVIWKRTLADRWESYNDFR